MAYYHDLITEKSFAELKNFRRNYDFILIGGWAVYLYTKGLKSRDIDFICTYEELQKLKQNYDLVKNERLKKYEIHRGDFDVDIYVPFFSDLGIPVEDLEKMFGELEGFKVLQKEVLLILKQKAYGERKGSLKGEKDKIDIIALLYSEIDLDKYKELLDQYKLTGYLKELIKLVKEVNEVKELNLSKHAYAKLRKRVLEEKS